MIRLFEELSLNRWPALQTTLYDGWLLRTANGYTRRANSVQLLYPSVLNVEQKIDYCEAFYRERGLPTIFKLTGIEQPPDLEVALIRRGYVADSHTSVQTRPIPTEPITVTHTDFQIEEYVSEDWLQDYIRLNSVDPRHLETMTAMLEGIEPQVGFFRLMIDGAVGAMGLGVIERGYVGIADVVTHPDYRKRGYAQQLILCILQWAQTNDAHTAYLQVMLNNAPALRLYDRLGYREIYRYWYRQQV